METNYINFATANASKCPMMLGTIDYLQNFLGKPHPSLESVGHKGSICPFTPQVLKNGTVSFAREIIDIQALQAGEKIKKSLLETHMPAFFNEIEPGIQEDKRKLACLLVIISGLSSADECNKFVSMVQKDLQPLFIQQGLLLSELHPFSNVPSARNPEFFTSRPPFPLFFIRRVIPNDVPYLLRKDRYSDEIYGKILFSLKRDLGIETVVAEMKRLNKEVDLTLLPKCRLEGGICDCGVVAKVQGFGFPWDGSTVKCKENGLTHL